MHPFLSLAVLGISAGAVSILPSFQKHPLQSKFSRRTFAHRGLFDHLSRPENSLLTTYMKRRPSTDAAALNRYFILHCQ